MEKPFFDDYDFLLFLFTLIILFIILVLLKKLKNNNKELNLLLNNIIEGVAVFENGKLIKANKQFLKIFGYEDFNEIYQKSYYDFIAQHDHNIIKRNLLNNSDSYEITFLKKNGEFIDGLAKGYNLEATYKRISTFIDISELKRTQNQLNELNLSLETKIKQEIEKNEQQQIILFQQSKLAEMGSMLNMIAHQWRQPLNNLSLNMNMLFLKIKKNKLDKDNLNKYKKEVKDQIDYLSNTIDVFQDFFKPQKEKEHFNIEDIVLNTNTLLSNQFNKKHIIFNFNYKNSIPYFGYKNELEQVLLNILNNSLDAFLECDVSVKKISIQLYIVTNQIVLKIEDNAGGIKDENINKIFDLYFSTKFEKNGTGLGLYICKTIISKHFKGDIYAKNINDGLETIIVFPK